MIKYSLSTTCLILFLFWPTQAQENAPPIAALGTPDISTVHTRFNTVSEASYLSQLANRGLRLEAQGLLIESLDASTIFVELNSNTAFNPASVIKIATSLAALTRFGPDYHFETAFHIDGPINKKTRTLKGDLILHSTGDPMLYSSDLTRLIKQVMNAGIRTVSGNLIVSGPFSYGNYYATERAASGLRALLRRLGVRVTGATKTGNVRGTRIASRQSSTLRDILFQQNAYSSNPIAERLGNTLGGPKAVEQFLVGHVGIPQDEVRIIRTSGLESNRITARGTVQLMRKTVQYLTEHNLHPEDVMPVAGIDPGTLRSRFAREEYRGAIVGKTGTLPATDGGVSTLAGILYTRDNGPILFAIFNTRGNVNTYRRLQDNLLKGLIEEFGGPSAFNASSRRLNN